MTFLSIPWGEKTLLLPLETAVEPSLPPDGRRALVVVLSGGLWRGKDGEAELGMHTLQRLIGGWEVAREHHWPLLVSGGDPGNHGGATIAQVMAGRVRQWGFDEPLIVEGESRTTWENLANTRKIMEEEGIRDIVLVTHAYHMKRSLLCALRAMEGYRIYPWPVGRLADEGDVVPSDRLPGAGYLYHNMIAIREHVGLFIYKYIH
jgi:uncharacterized SAM-binding protein YcdF (DUF218 family)